MGDFILQHTLVTAPGAQPARWMFVLHGIFGSSSNWRSFARRVTAACPSWGMILVDLRAHGLSQGALPPHSVTAAAADLVRLEQQLGLVVRGVMGHSFGGKAALAYAGLQAGDVDQAWILDAAPGPRGPDKRSDAEAILELLEALPERLPSREHFIERVLQRGHARPTAEWLAMNLKRAPVNEGALPAEDTFRLRLDLRAIRAMLEDYFAIDLWPVVERPGVARELHVVIGGRSTAVSPGDRSRFEALAAQGNGVYVHVLDGAGHLVHVDDPDGLFSLIEQALCR